MYYFRHVPEFDYPSRLKDAKQISEYTRVKNLFKRAKLADDIFADLSYFSKYKIIGDERPDNVAYKLYGDSTLDWLVLLANNIINQNAEWPLPQQSFYNYMIEKYNDESNIGNIHNYETKEYKRTFSVILYLENAEEGGGTEFVDTVYKPKAGYALIFPSNWCYMHSGQPVIKGKKRVAVTWYYVQFVPPK